MYTRNSDSRSPALCRTLLVEDHPVLGDLLASQLAREEGFVVVGVAHSAESALQFLGSDRPHLLVLDLGLPSTAEGLWVLREARRIDPNLKILVFSASSSMYAVHRSLLAGVDGFVEKTASWSELIQALRSVREGQKYFGSKVGERLVEAIRCEGRGLLLSTKEIVLLRLLAEGGVVKAIAEEMAVSVPTVYRLVLTVRAKLNVSTNEEMLRKAVALGYLEIVANPTSAPLRDEGKVTQPTDG